MDNTQKKKTLRGAATAGIFCAVAVAVFAVFSGSVTDAGRASDDEGRYLLEQRIRRAAVSCYASEGVYPPTLEYITARYGLAVDSDRFAVHYEIFADNIMPEITVVPLG